MTPTRVFVLLGVCMALAGPVRAQTTPAPAPKTFTAVRSTGPIVVDGVPGEAAWRQATVIPVAYESFPGFNTPAHAETTCLVTYSADTLYLAFIAKDPAPAEIRAHLADRDVPFLEDTVGVMLDTFNDGRRAFQFRINARGVQMDAFNSDVDGIEDWSWDAIWDAQARIGADGYTVEVAIPFSSLRFQRTTGPQTWGILAMRDMPRSTRFRMVSTVRDRAKQCLVCQFDKLEGLTGLVPGRNFELDPTVTAARTDARTPFPGGAWAPGDVKPQAGLSARWSVTPNVTFSGTANPDFYQVEADAAQLSVNQRFELFFPEKRPFFLEGADLFATPLNVFFSRTVADPNWGVKLSGKQGGTAFGAVVAQDDVTGIVMPGFDDSDAAHLVQRNLTTALRVRRDVGGAGSQVGAIYTGREGDAYSNRVAGVDGLWRIGGADSVRGQVVGAWTRYPGDVAVDFGQRLDGLAGGAYGAEYSHETREWAWEARHEGASPEFRADAGFISQVGVRQSGASIERVFHGGPTTWFNQVSIGAGADRTTDWAGGRASWGCDFPLEFSGRRQMTLSYNPACNHEYFDGRSYDNFRHNLNWSIRPNGSVSFNASATLGGAIDFANSRKADQTRLSAGMGFNALGGLEGTAGYTFQQLDVEGGRLFFAHQAQLRALYHLNLRTFIRAIVQYTDVRRTTALYLSPVSATARRTFSQFLFNYKLNPQTVLLVGYSDNAQGAASYDLTRTDRTFFVKIGYALVF